MNAPWVPSNDPRLLSIPQAKGSDVEARLNALIGGMGAVPPALSYTATTTVITQSVSGSYTWTCPAGVTSVKVECWGAGAGGGGGGGSMGGEGGGGGEYAAEPSYPVVPGQVYGYLVGNGGSGGTTGFGGSDGGATLFDTTSQGGGVVTSGVFANGGAAGSGFVGGAGGGRPAHGGASSNTVENMGGNGGGTGSQGTGGCGGGAAAGPNASGANGSTSSGSAGASGGAGGGGNGGANAANGSNGTAPGGGGGGCGAATSAATGSNTYRLSSSGTYFGSDATGGNANARRTDQGSTPWQGGETASGGSYNGTQKSLGIIGGNPQSDLSGKTIDKVTIRLQWTHTWYNNGANVILGYTNRTSLPSSWNAGGITSVKTWWQGNVGGNVTTDLTNQGLGTAMQSGAAKSICWGPGSSFNLNNYGSLYGSGGSNSFNPVITVNWHTGSTPVTAGNGVDGQVKITYSTSGVLQSALQPAAGTDGTGNTFAAGYTGPVTAIQPGTSPSLAETWHDMRPLSNGFVGTISGQYPPQYRLCSDGYVDIVGYVQTPAASGNYNNVAIFTMPSAYRPSANAGHKWPVSFGTNLTPVGVAALQVHADGTLQLHNSPTAMSSQLIGIYGRYPLDSSGLIQT